ncbi:MAG: DNA-binding response regulator [Desulfobacterales bacterium RIFOXYA12_FULL_46_15]|nr:MAG: DNA-binding response regulator [Desulfobacterales bacterium RIFOXYA12_FULL_46_15]
MKPVKILVAEDDPHIRMGLADALESEGYQVLAAEDGHKAESVWKQEMPDLILLDIMMPGKSGYDLCRDIRAKDEAIPIIMLTAKGEEIDKVVGLKLGADDYITKPFGVHELLARIAAVLRRTRVSQKHKTANSEALFFFGPFGINPRTYKLTGNGRTLDLTDRELKLIRYFHTHPGEVLSRDSLLNAAWGMDYYGTTRTLDQHIAQLRKKIEKDPARPELIVTVHGVGYRYEPKD